MTTVRLGVEAILWAMWLKLGPLYGPDRASMPGSLLRPSASATISQLTSLGVAPGPALAAPLLWMTS